MARKSRYTESENTGKRRTIPLIRYARQPMFLRGMRDVFRGRGITVEQSCHSGKDVWSYYDGRQFATMFPYITVPEIKEGRETDAPEHVMRALKTFMSEGYVPPGIGGQVFETWAKTEAERREHGNTG